MNRFQIWYKITGSVTSLWPLISVHRRNWGREEEVPLAELLRGGSSPHRKLGHPNDIKRKNWKSTPRGGQKLLRGGGNFARAGQNNLPPWPILVLRPCVHPLVSVSQSVGHNFLLKKREVTLPWPCIEVLVIDMYYDYSENMDQNKETKVVSLGEYYSSQQVCPGPVPP